MRSCSETLSESIKCGTRCLVSPAIDVYRSELTDATFFKVASKCGADCKEGRYAVTNSASHINEYIDDTIERLGFAPDLYYLHRIDLGKSRSKIRLGTASVDVHADTPLEESIPALDALRKAGKTKYIGVSECSAQTLRKANSSKTNQSLSQRHDTESG